MYFIVIVTILRIKKNGGKVFSDVRVYKSTSPTRFSLCLTFLQSFGAVQILNSKYSSIKNAPIIRVILHQRDFVGDVACNLCHREASLSRRP